MVHRVVEEALEPLVRGAARLLRVEASSPHAWVLRFDRATLEVSVAGRGLELALAPGAAPDAQAEVLDEADPWWTVLGEPLYGAWSATDTEGRRVALELQLRADDRRAKHIALTARDSRLEARVV